MAAAATATVQHVTKASSDQLLTKFAELDSERDPTPAQCSRLQMIRAPVAMRRKRSKRVAAGLGARDVAGAAVDAAAALAAVKRMRSGGCGEWNKGLLGPTPSSSARQSASVLRKMGIGRTERGTAALLAALEKVSVELIFNYVHFLIY